MAREVIVTTWCDPCLSAGSKVEGREVTASLNGSAALMLALCPTHGEGLWEPFAAIVEQYGQPLPSEPRKVARKVARKVDAEPIVGVPAGRSLCPVPECGKVATHKRISDHVRRAHGMGLREARALYGVPSAHQLNAAARLAQADLFGSDDVPPCPDCSLVAANRTGLAAHIRMRHPDMAQATRDGLFANPMGKRTAAERAEREAS